MRGHKDPERKFKPKKGANTTQAAKGGQSRKYHKFPVSTRALATCGYSFVNKLTRKIIGS